MGSQIVKGDGEVVGLLSRGPSVLLYSHLPHGESLKQNKNKHKHVRSYYFPIMHKL